MEIESIKSFEALTVNIDPIFVCHVKPVRQLEANYKEAIEALELLMKGVDGLPPLTAIAGVLIKQWNICLKVIENAYGEKWEDIQGEK